MLHAFFGASRFGNDDPSAAGGMTECGDEIILQGRFATRAMIDAVTFFRAGGIDLFDKFALCVTERGNFDFGRIGATFMRTMLVRFPTGFGTSRHLGLYGNDIVSERGCASGLQNRATNGTKYGFYAFLYAGGFDDNRPFGSRCVREFCNSLIGRVITTRASVVRFTAELGAGGLLPVMVDKVMTERVDICAVKLITAYGTKQCASALLRASRRLGHSPLVSLRVRQQCDIFAFEFYAANGTEQRNPTVFGASRFFGDDPFACRGMTLRGKNDVGEIGDLVFAGFIQEVHIAVRVEPIFHVAVLGASGSDRFGLDDRAKLGEVNLHRINLQILLCTESNVVRIDIFYGDRITVVGNDYRALVHVGTVGIVFAKSHGTNDLLDQSSVFCGNVDTAVVAVGTSTVPIACCGSVNIR